MRRKIEFMAMSSCQCFSRFGNKQIALAAYGFDQPWMHRVVADFRADARNAHVDGTVLAVVFDAAQGIKDFFARENPPGVGSQQPQQVELGTEIGRASCRER